MSLIMLLRSPDGLVLAADSRVTLGYTLKGPETRDDSIKFIQLNSDIGIMTYGLFDIGTMSIKTLKEKIDSNGYRDFPMKEIIDKGKNIFARISNDWMMENPDIKNKERNVGFIIGGLDRQEMLFKVYNFESPEFIPKMITSNFFLAGQWHIARFFLTKLNPEKATMDSLKNLAAISVIATMGVDKTVGGPIRLATITKSKGFQWVNDEEMEKILDFNALFCEFFKGLLQTSLNAVSSSC